MVDRSDRSQEPLDRAAPRSALRDWRVWLGLAISVVSIAWVVRGVPLDEVRAAMAEARIGWLVAWSVPAYVLNVWLRALRWRHLTNPLADIPRTTLYRAQSLGFMVNNLMPLRVGELVRSWYLAREARCSAAAVIGTVVLERVLDMVSLLAVVTASLLLLEAGGDDGGLLSRGAQLLLPVVAAPVAGLVVLRLAPDAVLRLAGAVCRPLPPRLGEMVQTALGRFAEGLGALKAGPHLFWIAIESAVIWLVASTLPVLAALYAFDIQLGSPVQTLVVSWILLAAVGAAVAIPSAPGFFGPYQLACKEVLVRFGVDPATALALGLLVWLVFWASLVGQGLVVVGLPGRSLGAAAARAGKDPSPERR